jgi:hypothetical protein
MSLKSKILRVAEYQDDCPDTNIKQSDTNRYSKKNNKEESKSY